MTTDNDQAAVEALCKIKHEIRGRSVQGTWSKEWGIGVDGARAIIDAIRKGEVPGVYCSSCDFRDLWKSAEKDLESLRAEVARLKLDVRDAKQAADYNRTCWGNEKARADKAEKRLADYDARLTAVMAPDFKCWHQNSRDEWPEVAAWVITNLRQQIEVERSHADQATAERDRLAEVGK